MVLDPSLIVTTIEPMPRKPKPRTMAIRDVKARLTEAIEAAQKSYVLVTRHGKPVAIIVGVDGMDMIDVVRRFGESGEGIRAR